MTDRRPAGPLRRLHATLAALPLACLGLAMPADAAVMISQVYGGGGNAGAPLSHDFIELHNGGATAVSLAGWSLQYASATGTTWSGSTALSGSIPAGGYFLVRLGSTNTAVGAALPVDPDVSNGGVNLSATAGKLALVSGTSALSGSCPTTAPGLVDLVGYGITASCAETAPSPAPSNTTAVLRRTAGTGCQDSGNNGADFTAVAPAPRNGASPAQPCGGGGSGGGGGMPLDAEIPAIQGSGAQSPLVNRVVTTRGVVTKVTSNGFFIQALTGDNDPATSDGLFVFAAGTAHPAAVVGNLVSVTGTVTEFDTGAAPTAHTPTPTVTELTSLTGVTQVGNGYSIAPTLVTLPEAVEGELERYEGMLVTLRGPFTVAQNFFLGRYGQLTLAVGGRLETPTNRHRPGPQASALDDENARRRIVLDDGSSLQNPAPTPYLVAGSLPRAGDTTGDITGVIDFGLATSTNPGLGDHRIHPTAVPVFSAANPRTGAPQTVGGNVKVASFNVLNYFTTFTNGATAGGQTGQGCTLGASTAASNCRGADSLAEFQRQRAKIVEAMAAIDADVLGLMEIQNNRNAAVQNLVDALNARVGAGSYATVAVPAQGTGTDAIRVAMIYKPARLGPLGAPVSDTDAVNSRPPLAQTFGLGNGERFTLVVNHLKSKGSCPAAGDADADPGDGQGCWNVQRRQQVQRLRGFVAQLQAASGSSDVLLIGDFNAYAQEDPIHDLTGNGFVDQVGRFSSFGYSYVFDGAAGRLDHAIASATLSARVSGAMHWHVNADEAALADYNLEFKAPLACNGGTCPADPYTVSPYRSSDHDPVVVGLNLYKTVTAASSRGTLTGSAGDDLLIGGVGANVMTGGAGRNVFVYQSMRDAGDTVTDFVPAKDRIDLRTLIASLGTDAASALARGVVRLVASGGDTLLQIDTDGSAGPVPPRTLATLQGVAPAAIAPARDLILL